MIVKNAEGRSIEIEVMGDVEHPEIDDAYYVDNEDDVTDEDLEYVMQTYAAEIDEYLMEKAVGMSEDFCMGER